MINKAKILLDFILRRNKLSGKYKVDEYSDIARLAQLTVLRKMVKDGIEKQSFDSDEISPMLESDTIAISNAVFPKPSDMYHFISLTNNRIKIEELRDKEYFERIRSSVAPPTLEFPVMRRTKNAFEVRPEQIQSVDINYVRTPVDPEWAYTVVNNEPVYDEPNSTDFELPVNMLQDLVMEMLELVGLPIRRTDLVNYSIQQQNEQEAISGTGS